MRTMLAKLQGLRFEEVKAWGMSFIVHVGLLLAFASITHVTIEQTQKLLVKSDIEKQSEEPEFDFQEFKFSSEASDQIGGGGANSLGSGSGALAATMHAGDALPGNVVEREIRNDYFKVDMPTSIPIFQPSNAELTEKVAVAGQTERVSGVKGAMDRLAFEIAGMVKDKPTLVIWAFDASGSLIKQRADISQRMKKVYDQLGLMKVGSEGALKTAAVTFQHQVNVLTPDPIDTDKIDGLLEAINKIPIDLDHTEEMVFTACEQAINKWMAYKTKQRRNIAIIIVTDERGDDMNKLEPLIDITRRFGIKVYCVGHASMFGKQKGVVDWTYPDGYVGPVDVDQGPESFYQELLDLPFWGSQNLALERLSAAQGPYALARLCNESGGIYMITDDSKAEYNFDPAVMRSYQPDYRPVEVIRAEVEKNPAKMALIAAINASSVERIEAPAVAFRADRDEILRTELTEAQKPLAVLDYRLTQMLTALEQGVKYRDAIKEPRWQASYDLALGRALAIRARAFGYNVMLAEMKSSPKTFSDPKKFNQWRLIPSDKVESGPQVKKQVDLSRQYLQRVIDDHPGTPWALIAKHELSQPLGWEWREGTMVIPNQQAMDPNRPMLLLEEEMRMNNMNRPPERVKPKL